MLYTTTGAILVSEVLMKAEKGDTSSPHMFPAFLKSRLCQAFSQSVRSIVEYLHIQRQVLHDHREQVAEIV